MRAKKKEMHAVTWIMMPVRKKLMSTKFWKLSLQMVQWTISLREKANVHWALTTHWEHHETLDIQGQSCLWELKRTWPQCGRGGELSADQVQFWLTSLATLCRAQPAQVYVADVCCLHTSSLHFFFPLFTFFFTIFFFSQHNYWALLPCIFTVTLKGHGSTSQIKKLGLRISKYLVQI